MLWLHRGCSIACWMHVEHVGSVSLCACVLPAQVQECCVTMFPQLLVLLTLHAPHALHHLLTQLHRRRQWFWVPPQNVAKINMEQLSWCRKQDFIYNHNMYILTHNYITHFDMILYYELKLINEIKSIKMKKCTSLGEKQVVQMSVPNSKNIGDDTVTSCDICTKYIHCMITDSTTAKHYDKPLSFTIIKHMFRTLSQPNRHVSHHSSSRRCPSPQSWCRTVLFH